MIKYIRKINTKDLWFYWDDKPLLLYNAKPTLDANGGGVKNPNPHYDPKALTDASHPHYKDPDYTSEFYSDYTKEVKNFFYTAEHVVGDIMNGVENVLLEQKEIGALVMICVMNVFVIWIHHR